MLRSVVMVVCLLLLSGHSRADIDAVSTAMSTAREAHLAGDYRRAKDVLTKALSEVPNLGTSDTRRAEVTTQLADSLLELGEYARCEKLCTDAIEIIEKRDGEQNLHTAEAERILTELYVLLRIPKLADHHCKRGLKICESIYGREHPKTAEFYANMRQIWNLCSGCGNSANANDALQFLEKSLGKLDPRLIALLEAMAGDCYDRWTPADAARAVSIAETSFGARHPVYGWCLSTYATALRYRRDFDQAEIVTNQSIEVLSLTFGRNCPQLSGAFRNLASIERHRGRSDRANFLVHESIRLRFCTLSDVDLCDFFDRCYDSDQFRSYDIDLVDNYLAEMARRGGEIIEQFLDKKIESLRRSYEQVESELKRNKGNLNLNQEEIYEEKLKRLVDIMHQKERYSRNLELMTTLCRSQKKPDPLQIVVEGSPKLTGQFPKLPALNVTIKNFDLENREIGFQQSGDYRSGRQARWRIEVKDATGRVKPVKELRGIIMGGGLYQNTMLEPGEGWQTLLNMSGFVETLEPGEYEVRIQYHNRLSIVDWETVAGLIVCQSEPIKLTVKRRSIQVTKKQLLELAELLKRFDDQQSCMLIKGKYGEWAHQFIDPASDYGRLLNLDWSAVPTLIDELVRQGQSNARRAHLLAVLFSITGENCPVSADFLGTGRSSPLGTYKLLDGGWNIVSKQAGENGWSSGGFGVTSGPKIYDTKLDADEQIPLIERWKEFKSHCEVSFLE